MRFTAHLRTAVLMTLATTLLLGVVYPLVVTGLAQTLFRDQANGQLIYRDGRLVGSRLIGQRFESARYFHGRPSAAGAGYDAAASGGSNLGPTSRALSERVASEVERLRRENPSQPVPVDLVTASASGLDPHISPDAARFQVPRLARERHIPAAELEALITERTERRQFGVLGEPVVNVLLLNLDVDRRWP